MVHSTQLPSLVNMQRRGDPDNQALQVIETQPYIEPQTKPFKLFTKKAGGDASPKEDNQSARHAARPSYKDEKAVEEAELQRRAICEEILVSGCVQSFVDFFYLMHRPDPKAGKGTRSVVPDRRLPSNYDLCLYSAHPSMT